MLLIAETSVNGIPVTYLQSPVQQMQPARNMFVNSSDQRVGVYFPPNQQTFIQSVPVYSNEASLLQMSPHQYQPYIPPPYYPYAPAAGRGTREKDKDESDLDKNPEYKECVSRGILAENLNGDLKVSSLPAIYTLKCPGGALGT